MKKTALSAVFYLLLAGLILLVLLIGGTAESGKLLQDNPDSGTSKVKPISAYEQARRIVGLAVSDCWVTLENANMAGRRSIYPPSVQTYIDCTIGNLRNWELAKEEPDIDPVK